MEVPASPQAEHWTACAHCARDGDRWTCLRGIATPGTACAGCHGYEHHEVAVPLPRLKAAVQYLAAEASLALNGPLAAAAVEARLTACRACDALQEDATGLWCGACGCGRRSRAELTVKATMPGAKCPRGLWPAAETAVGSARPDSASPHSPPAA